MLIKAGAGITFLVVLCVPLLFAFCSGNALPEETVLKDKGVGPEPVSPEEMNDLKNGDEVHGDFPEDAETLELKEAANTEQTSSLADDHEDEETDDGEVDEDENFDDGDDDNLEENVPEDADESNESDGDFPEKTAMEEIDDTEAFAERPQDLQSSQDESGKEKGRRRT